MSGWTDERFEAAKRMYADGASALEIAKKLGDGLTRNAVIGKLTRAGLTRAGSTTAGVSAKINRGGYQKPKSKAPPDQAAPRLRIAGNGAVFEEPAVPRPPRETVEPDPDANAGLFKLEQLEPHHCRWPIGDPWRPEFGFCGARRNDGDPYCAEHVKRAWSVRTDAQKAGDKTRSKKQLAIARRRFSA